MHIFFFAWLDDLSMLVWLETWRGDQWRQLDREKGEREKSNKKQKRKKKTKVFSFIYRKNKRINKQRKNEILFFNSVVISSC
jgi:hypothetical protein